MADNKSEVAVKVGDSVRKSIDDWEKDEQESAMLHACNAVDGTAKKTYPDLGNAARFTKLLRANYAILGPMGMPGTNLVETRFPVNIKRPLASDGKPDIADVIYGIHRCSHGHGDELPEGFKLIADAKGIAGITTIEVVRGAIRLSDRMIFALIAVAVLSPMNCDQTVPDGYSLTFGAKRRRLIINEWWGKEADFPAIVAEEPMPPSVTLDFSNWIT
jgi:hypothetical protein